MRSIKIPYTLKGETYYPLLQLIIKKGGSTLKTEALVDSGASISVFQESIADYFNLDITSGEKRVLQSISGKITAFIHEVKVHFDELTFSCKIAFSKELTTSFNILGRDNFFNFFKITFDEKNKELTLIPK